MSHKPTHVVEGKSRGEFARVGDVEDIMNKHDREQQEKLLPTIETVAAHDAAIGDLNTRLRALEDALKG